MCESFLLNWKNALIFASPTKKERCRSGRTGQSRKLLNSLWVPGVRIPLSPQNMKRDKLPSSLEQLFFFIFCKARRRRAGMCDRREQIPPKRGMADKVGMVLPPTKPSPRRRLSRFAPRGQCSGVSAEFFNLPAALPFSLHNGSRFRISLPLWNFFSAVSLQQALWTPLSLGPLSTTAPIPAFLCRCGTSFPPYPCYGFPGRHCLPSPLPQRHQFLHFPAVVERTDVLTFGR